MNKKNLIKNEKGQVLLFVVVAMSIALAVGVAISSRTLSSLSRTSRTDTASRVYAAAEGGIEEYLNKSNEELATFADAYAHNTLDTTCPAGTYVAGSEGALNGCEVEYNIPGENITARAVVTIMDFKSNETIGANKFYTFNLGNGETKETNLDGYSGNIDICWNDAGASAAIPDLYIMVYSSSGIISKEILTPPAGSNNSAYYTNGASSMSTTAVANGGGIGYSYCLNNKVINPNTYGLRVKALFDNAKVGVKGAGASDLPVQGYQIVSRGELEQEGVTKSIKTMKVYKSLPYLPGVFENAIYSEDYIAQ